MIQQDRMTSVEKGKVCNVHACDVHVPHRYTVLAILSTSSPTIGEVLLSSLSSQLS